MMLLLFLNIFIFCVVHSLCQRLVVFFFNNDVCAVDTLICYKRVYVCNNGQTWVKIIYLKKKKDRG